MIAFIKYIIRYFTHIRPIEIPKDGFLKKGQWNKISCELKIKDNGYFDISMITIIPLVGMDGIISSVEYLPVTDKISWKKIDNIIKNRYKNKK